MIHFFFQAICGYRISSLWNGAETEKFIQEGRDKARAEMRAADKYVEVFNFMVPTFLKLEISKIFASILFFRVFQNGIRFLKKNRFFLFSLLITF